MVLLLKQHGSYLQGMETKFLLKHWCYYVQARILPTRNGNYSSLSIPSFLKEAGTDPTYKEWKRLEHITTRLILLRTDPTYKEWKPRASREVLGSEAKRHGSYLQGMET